MKVYEEEPPWSVMGWAGQGGMCPHSALDDTDNRWGDWRPSWRCVCPDTGEIRRDCLETRGLVIQKRWEERAVAGIIKQSKMTIILQWC